MDFLNIQNINKQTIENIIMNNSKLLCDKIIKHCTTVDQFILVNLINLYEYIYLFIYNNFNYLSEKDIENIYKINETKKIITLQICNNLNNKSQMENNYEYDNNYDEDKIIDDTKYFKKYISCFVQKKIYNKLKNNIQLYNHFKGTNIKIITAKELEKYNYRTNQNKKIINDGNTLTFNSKKESYITFYNINFIFEHFKCFDKKLVDSLDNEYEGLLIYEDAINTETNLLEIISEINNLIYYI
jgi:hypothetical protein